jgi:hypothetical protein
VYQGFARASAQVNADEKGDGSCLIVQFYRVSL